MINAPSLAKFSLGGKKQGISIKCWPNPAYSGEIKYAFPN